MFRNSGIIFNAHEIYKFFLKYKYRTLLCTKVFLKYRLNFYSYFETNCLAETHYYTSKKY